MVKAPKVALLLTGNELMSGDTVDSNSALIARALAGCSLQVVEKATVGDNLDLLRSTLSRLAKTYDAIIINGGLGPTQDDLTAEVVASLVDGGKPIENQEARQHVEQWCAARNIKANQANLKQAYLPRGSEIVPNPVGSAVGFACDLYRALVIATPGVPSELEAMLGDVVHRVVQRLGGSQAHLLRLQTFGIGESTVQQIVKETMPDWPWEVELGFRASMPQLELKLAVETDQQRDALAFCEQKLMNAFGDHILGTGDVTLAGELQRILREQGKTITAAESCTGGHIAAMITAEAGSSAVFGGGFVTYSNAMKQQMLGVDPETLNAHGAVSEPVVREMLAGALAHSGADIGIAVSGIAGPGGGTPDKPVGTVWIAWGTAEDTRCRRICVTGSRKLFQALVSAACLDLVRRQLLDLPPEAHYFQRQAQ